MATERVGSLQNCCLGTLARDTHWKCSHLVSTWLTAPNRKVAVGGKSEVVLIPGLRGPKYCILRMVHPLRTGGKSSLYVWEYSGDVRGTFVPRRSPKYRDILIDSDLTGNLNAPQELTIRVAHLIRKMCPGNMHRTVARTSASTMSLQTRLAHKNR